MSLINLTVLFITYVVAPIAFLYGVKLVFDDIKQQKEIRHNRVKETIASISSQAFLEVSQMTHDTIKRSYDADLEKKQTRYLGYPQSPNERRRSQMGRTSYTSSTRKQFEL